MIFKIFFDEQVHNMATAVEGKVAPVKYISYIKVKNVLCEHNISTILVHKEINVNDKT